MLKTIITIKAYNRPYYLSQVLSSLFKQPDLPDIFVSLDNHKDPQISLRLLAKYPSISYVYQENNIGCAGNMRECFEYAFEKNDYDYMIHLEDDTIVGGDYLRWMTWAGEETLNSDIFAVCPSRSNDAQKSFKPYLIESQESNYLFKAFECQGGFGMHRKQYERIKELGGIVGLERGNKKIYSSSDSFNKFLISKNAYMSDKGSWGIPFNEYFREDRYCLFPNICRSNNIGSLNGTFNPNPRWHKEHIFIQDWIDTITLQSNLMYQKPIILNPSSQTLS